MYNIYHINNIFLAAHNSYRLNLFLHCYVMWRKLACVLSLSKYQHHSKRIQLSTQYCLHTFDFTSAPNAALYMASSQRSPIKSEGI